MKTNLWKNAVLFGAGAVLIWGVLLANDSEAMAQTGDVVLLEFYSDWCGACREMEPAVEALATAGAKVERINIDREKELAVKYGIQSIPCFVAVADGVEVDRVAGVCSYQRLAAMSKHSDRVDDRSPRPAWRYEQPVGYREATVRIFCQENSKTRSIGSGALVRWNGRLLVLTARHVIHGAKSVLVELCTRKTHWAKVVKVDAVWDCAVLELVGTPADVVPVELERGEAAMQHEGDRLESCGYGPDGKLACNTGLFQGYRRSTAAGQGPDDWMVISGHARGGDSGGPVFNKRGRLVGVLWGTDGREVVCVQAGRLHVLLDQAVAAIEQHGRSATVPAQLSALQRMPTPAKPSEMDRAQQECLRNRFGAPCPSTPSPNVIVQSDPELRRVLGSIDGKVGVLIEQRQADRNAEAADAEGVSPLAAGLCVLGAVAAGFVVYFVSQKS